MSKKHQEHALITSIGTKPQFKNKLRKLTPAEFTKIESLLIEGLKDIRAENESKELKELETKQIIESQLKEMANKFGIQLSEIKSHINKL